MPQHPAQRPVPMPHLLIARAATWATAPVAASATDLTRVYGRGETRVSALDPVSGEFERRRFTAIMGPSGSGKSTLITSKP
jgi:putative ABC transport system ATP-binding protein